jgi:hypothetical protein
VNKPVNNVDKKDTTSKHVDKQPMKPNITQSNEVKEISEQEEQSDIIPGQKNINDYPEYKPNGSSEEEESDIETSDIDTEEEETVIESKETVSETEEIVIKNIETVNEVVEKVEADIVEKTSQDDELHNDDSQLLYKDNNLEISLYSETGELKIIINNNIHAIKAINSHTGNLWEVEVD